MTIKTDVEVKKLRLSDLEHADYNPREITGEALQGLHESIRDLGLLELPVVNTKHKPHRIVSGHQRVTNLLQAGVIWADCIVVQMDDPAEIAANLTMNNPAIRGSYDVPKALDQVEGLLPKLPKPDYMGFAYLEADLRSQASRLSIGATNATDSVVSEVKPTSKEGHVYLLGKHHLICGSFELLPALMKRKRAAACVTDPPYNVAYVDSSGESIENDDMKPNEWEGFVESFVRVIFKLTKGPCFVFMSSKELPSLDSVWTKLKGRTERLLFWIKDRFTIGRGDYHHMHEPILFGLPPKVVLPELPIRTNVLEIPKPPRNVLHPTQKPVELIRTLLEDCTAPGDIVLEPFAGSGTTLVVAEELGRVCYASELRPEHCDTIRRRWAEQTQGEGCDWKKATPGKKLG